MNLLILDMVEINHVKIETESAFLARKINNNWAILLEADIGVHNG